MCMKWVNKTILIASLMFSYCFAQEYEVSVTSVNVWVKVTDKSGNPITNLTSHDFEIFEDDKKVGIGCFEEMEPSSQNFTQSLEIETQPSQSEQSAETSSIQNKRVFFLIDLFNTSQPEYLFIKPKLIEFVKKISSKWSFTVALLLPSGIMEIRLSSTTDIGRVIKDLEDVHANPKRDLKSLDKRRMISLVLQSGGGEDAIRRACRLAQQYTNEELSESGFALESLAGFEKYLSKLEGDVHTVVFFISGGINAKPGKQYFDYISGGDSWELGKSYPECEPNSGSELEKDLRKVIAKMNRHNITFYSINTRGSVNPMLDTAAEADRRIQSTDFEFLDNFQDFMFEMANETGGLTFDKSLNFDLGFNRVLQDLDHHYILCYNAPHHKKKGDYHKIKIKCKQPNTIVRYRKGYSD
jgi:VWFA-related protein